MDLFPLVLSNREMQALSRLIEQRIDRDYFDYIPPFDFPHNLDEIQASLAQMDAQEMTRFLRGLKKYIEGNMEEMQTEIMPTADPKSRQEFANQDAEVLRALRQENILVSSLLQKVRRPRGR